MSSAERAVSIDELLVHGPFLRALARGLVADSLAADDAVQETLGAALRRPPTEWATSVAWLKKVMSRFALQARRGEGRRQLREKAGARAEALPSTEEVVEREELRRVLIEAVLRLEEPYRSVLLLRYYRDVDVHGIARIQNRPIETVRTQLKRGLDQLREILDARTGREKWRALVVPLAAERSAAAASFAFPVAAGVLGCVVAVLGWIWLREDPEGQAQQVPSDSRPNVTEWVRPEGDVPTPIEHSPFAKPNSGQEERVVLSGEEILLPMPGAEPRDARGRPTTLVTRLLDATTSLPVSQGLVSVVREASFPTTDRWIVLASAHSDAEGWVRIGLPPNYEAFHGTLVSAHGYSPLIEQGDTLDSPLWLTPGIDVPVRMEDEVGQPIVGARLEYIFGCGHMPNHRVAITDESGHAVIPCVTPGEGDLWWAAPGFTSDYDSLEAWRPGQPPQVFRPKRGVVHEGVLLDAEGFPVADAFLGQALRHRGPWVRTDAQGRFQLIGLSDRDEINVYLDEVNDGPAALVVQGLSGSTQNLVLRLPREVARRPVLREARELPAEARLPARPFERPSFPLVELDEGATLVAMELPDGTVASTGRLVLAAKGRFEEATIQKDGESLGFARFEGLVSAGARLRFEESGWHDHTFIVPEHSGPLRFRLPAGVLDVLVVTEPFNSEEKGDEPTLILDGHAHRNGAGNHQVLRGVISGTHELTVVAAGHVAKTLKVNVQEGEPLKIQIALRRSE